MLATRVRCMQARWTLMKLVILALALTSVAWVERTPDRVSVRISADYAGTMTAVEINGTRFSREDWHSGEGRRWLRGTLLACGADGSLAVDFQVDDSIRWEEAHAVMRVAFDTKFDPEVFIVETGHEARRIPIWRPEEPTPTDSVPFAMVSSSANLNFAFSAQVILTGGEPPAVFLDETRLGDGPPGIESLRKEISSLVKFQGFTLEPEFHIAANTRFRWVRAAMKTLQVECKTAANPDSKTAVFYVFGLEWLPPIEEPYRTHGGVI